MQLYWKQNSTSLIKLSNVKVILKQIFQLCMNGSLRNIWFILYFKKWDKSSVLAISNSSFTFDKNNYV